MTRTRHRQAARLALGVSLCAGALGTPLAAQKPPKRTLVEIHAYTSTPGRAEFTPSVVNRLHVPAGFRVSVWAQGLGSPRMLAVSDDGTVYVTSRDSNNVIALRDENGRAGTPRKVVTNLAHVHGIALHEGKMYLATVKEVYVADMTADGGVGTPRAIITTLPDGGQHQNRTLGFGPDGKLYISVGSTCNQCAESTPESATILRAEPDGSSRGVYASGLRNTIGWGFHPQTGEMWGMDNGFDLHGNDIPPEELNKIQSGNDYGWPYCYDNRRPDSVFASEPPGTTKAQHCPRTVAPVLTYRAHSAPIQLTFYSGTQFPAEFRGDAFVAMRGSWGREPPSGYEVARVHFENGQATRIEPFLTGFLSADHQQYYARPAGVAVAKDGSLLMSDDTNGAIYRVSYGAPGTSAVPNATPRRVATGGVR